MKREDTAAFSLVEVTLALGVGAFCLLAVLALLPIGITSNQTSINETTAAGIAGAIAADLRASVVASKTTSLTQSGVFHIPFPFTGTNTVFVGDTGQLSGNANEDASPTANPFPRYRTTIYFTAPTGKNATVTRLLI